MQSLKTCGQAIAGLIVWAIIIGVGIAVCQSVTGEPDAPAPQVEPDRTPTARSTPTARPTSTPRPTPTPVPVPTTGDATAEKCLSPWDGSHRGTNDLIKAELLSPDSFEHKDTYYRTALVAGGRLLEVRVEFTAANAFGVQLRGRGYGRIDVQTCEAVAGGVIE